MAGAGYFGSGVVYRPIDQKQRAIVLHKLSSGFARPPRRGIRSLSMSSRQLRQPLTSAPAYDDLDAIRERVLAWERKLSAEDQHAKS